MIHDSLEAVFQDWHIEVDEEANAFVRGFEIGQELRGMNWQHFFGGFDFNYNRIFHNQIHPICGLEFDALITDRQRRLPLKLESPLTQFITKAFFIDRFQ
jgi:hypothetical protein